MNKADKNYEYFKEVDKLTTEKLGLENAAHKYYNEGWKLMNKYRFSMKLAAEKEKKIIKAVTDFKNIEYTKKTDENSRKRRKNAGN